MARPHFDEEVWITRLDAALETVTANAQPSYSLRPPEMMRSGLPYSREPAQARYTSAVGRREE